MKKALITGIMTVLVVWCPAQSMDLLGIHSSSTLGGIAYSHVDLTNDTVIDHTLLPGFISSIYNSSTADAVNSIFYVCDGMHLYGINTATDSLVFNLILPLPSLMGFCCMQYNACDSSIYGVTTDVTNDQISGVYRFKPADSTLALMASVTGTYHRGGQGAIDPANNIYMFEMGGSNSTEIGGFDIALGAISFLTPVSPLNPSIIFRGIRYDCANARLVGLEILSGQNIHYSTVDLLTGNLTQLSAVPIANVQYFADGGACMNHSTGEYYYSATQTVFNRFDGNGNWNSSDTISGPAVLLIETMTACPCPISLATNEVTPGSVRLFPNPCTDFVTIEMDECEIGQTLTLYSSSGQLLHSSEITRKTEKFDFNCYSPGIYYFIVSGELESRAIMLVKE